MHEERSEEPGGACEGFAGPASSSEGNASRVTQESPQQTHVCLSAFRLLHHFCVSLSRIILVRVKRFLGSSRSSAAPSSPVAPSQRPVVPCLSLPAIMLPVWSGSEAACSIRGMSERLLLPSLSLIFLLPLAAHHNHLEGEQTELLHEPGSS